MPLQALAERGGWCRTQGLRLCIAATTLDLCQTCVSPDLYMLAVLICSTTVPKCTLPSGAGACNRAFNSSCSDTGCAQRLRCLSTWRDGASASARRAAHLLKTLLLSLQDRRKRLRLRRRPTTRRPPATSWRPTRWGLQPPTLSPCINHTARLSFFFFTFKLHCALHQSIHALLP